MVCEAELAWKCLLMPTYLVGRGAILSSIVVQPDLVFGLWSQLFCRSVRARLQFSVYSGYDVMINATLVNIQTHTQTTFWIFISLYEYLSIIKIDWDFSKLQSHVYCHLFVVHNVEPVCLCHQAVLICYQPRDSDLIVWESNCGPGGK